MKAIHVIAFILLIIGGLNWLAVGISPAWDLSQLLGVTFARVIYVLVGISALIEVFSHKKSCKACATQQM